MSLQVYDDFGQAGYSLTDYHEKWMTPNGLGEMAVEDTRSFSGGRFHLSAVPFQTGSDVGVDDHRKYLAVSTHTFPVPPDGTLVLSADVKASTPGTVPGLTQLGVYGPSGSWLDPAKPATRNGLRTDRTAADGCHRECRQPGLRRRHGGRSQHDVHADHPGGPGAR